MAGIPLYQIADDYAAILEDDGIDDETTAELLDQIGGAFDDKAAALAAHLKNMHAESTALETEEKRLRTRRAALDNRIKHRRQYALRCLKAAGKDNAGNAVHKLSVRGCAPSVDVPDIDAVPEAYVRRKETVEPDKRAIRDLLESLDSDKRPNWASLVKGVTLGVK